MCGVGAENLPGVTAGMADGKERVAGGEGDSGETGRSGGNGGNGSGAFPGRGLLTDPRGPMDRGLENIERRDSVDNGHSDVKVRGRRRTLQLIGIGLAGGALGIGCKDSGETPGKRAGGPSCDSAVDEASQTQRKTLQYHERAADQTKNCLSCAQYVDGQYGDCGGCKLMSGPVKAKGGCTSFAPKEGGAATPT